VFVALYGRGRTLAFSFEGNVLLSRYNCAANEMSGCSRSAELLMAGLRVFIEFDFMFGLPCIWSRGGGMYVSVATGSPELAPLT